MLVVGPDRVPGCAGTLVPTALHLATLLPHGPVAVTHTLPPGYGYGFGKLTVIELLPAPAVIVPPVGTVQLYPVAPDTVGTEKVTPVAPGHTADDPVIGDGTTGLFEMVMHRGALVDDPPQANAAVTHKFPEVKAGNTTLTLVVPLLVIVAPGTEKVQL